MQCQITKLCEYIEPVLEKLQSLSLLFLRFILAYGFYEPAKTKWSDINSVAEWFGSMGFPLPTLQAYMAASTEALGVLLLTVGFATRLISIPLIVVMIVAILTVHLGNGFSSGDNGFEIPLYYMLMLLVLVSHGAGKFSVDHFLYKDK
ncbi:MAG: DoxX family protein [Sulfurimonadaceae bacterium]